MFNFIGRLTARIHALFGQLQVKQVMSIVLVGFLLLATEPKASTGTKAVKDRLDKIVHQDESIRPRTTGEWNQQARETQNDSGERFKRIGEQSSEAVKEFGEVYPSTAERSASDVQAKTH